VGSNTVSAPLLVGATGHAIDLFPSATLDSQGTLWCAWDCSSPSRSIRLARFGQATGAFTQANTFGTQGLCCTTPELSPASGNSLLLAFSQRGPIKPAHGKIALLRDGRAIATVAVAEDMDVLFPQAQQGPDGQYWVAYEKSGPKGSQVVLRRITGGFTAGAQ
jgi:hypothetical protein